MNNNYFPKRAIYFSVVFVLPAMLMICNTVFAATAPTHPDLGGIMAGSGVFSAMCVFVGVIALYNDNGA